MRPSERTYAVSTCILPFPLRCGALFCGGANRTSRPRGYPHSPRHMPRPPVWRLSYSTRVVRLLHADNHLGSCNRISFSSCSSPIRPDVSPIELDRHHFLRREPHLHGDAHANVGNSFCRGSLSACPRSLLLVIADLLTRAFSTRGVTLRDAALEALLLFPNLELGPQRPRASSSSVKTEIAARLYMWRRGCLHELAMRTKALACQRPSVKRNKSARAARRTAKLIRKNQFTIAVSLA